MKKETVLLLLNTLSLVFALAMNFLSGSRVFNGKSVGDISNQLTNLFTPAGYAFAIWGVIYLLLILFAGYQWFTWIRKSDDKEIHQTGIWFALGNVANGLWIIAWLNEQIGLSVILMFVLLLSLIVLTVRLRLEIWDAPVRIIAFVWWPVCIYIGWIIVATVANVAAFLINIGWNGAFMSAKTWTILMIIASTLIYLLLIYFRNMREAALVGIWALVAIVVKQWQENQSIVLVSVAAILILLTAASIHGFKNRKTSPFKKIKRGEI